MNTTYSTYKKAHNNLKLSSQTYPNIYLILGWRKPEDRGETNFQKRMKDIFINVRIENIYIKLLIDIYGSIRYYFKK
jgi:hypothetical protein